MGRQRKIAEIAAERGMSEAELLAKLLATLPTAKEIAAVLELSGAAVTMALERNGFVHRSEWIRADKPAELCEVLA